jgi:hypothetical protein
MPESDKHFGWKRAIASALIDFMLPFLAKDPGIGRARLRNDPTVALALFPDVHGLCCDRRQGAIVMKMTEADMFLGQCLRGA